MKKRRSSLLGNRLDVVFGTLLSSKPIALWAALGKSSTTCEECEESQQENS